MTKKNTLDLRRTPIAISPSKELAHYGVFRTLDARVVPLSLLCLAVMVPLLIFTISYGSASADYAARVATVAAACFAMVLGYHQWRAARHEVSIDKYYDRLDPLDKRLDASEKARALVNHFWEDSQVGALDYEEAMYIYAELDILEYAIEKYRMGFMSAALALRAVNNFGSRCRSKIFAEHAVTLVTLAGYTPRTANAVNVIVSLSKSTFKGLNNLPT